MWKVLDLLFRTKLGKSQGSACLPGTLFYAVLHSMLYFMLLPVLTVQ